MENLAYTKTVKFLKEMISKRNLETKIILKDQNNRQLIDGRILDLPDEEDINDHEINVRIDRKTDITLTSKDCNQSWYSKTQKTARAHFNFCRDSIIYNLVFEMSL